jgi:hypothetical protein
MAPIIEVHRFHIAFVSRHCLHRPSTEKDLVMGAVKVVCCARTAYLSVHLLSNRPRLNEVELG